jgi:tyrosyl-tRNA synthetase
VLYAVVQGYDFVHMRRQYGVRVQVGGSDQWGNILAGTDLMRRMMGGPEAADACGPTSSSSSSSSSDTSGSEASDAAAPTGTQQGAGAGSSDGSEGAAADPCFGLTFPLLLKADGSKFGKSEGGAVWLNADMLSPYQFYQFLFKTADAGE